MRSAAEAKVRHLHQACGSRDQRNDNLRRLNHCLRTQERGCFEFNFVYPIPNLDVHVPVDPNFDPGNDQPGMYIRRGDRIAQYGRRHWVHADEHFEMQGWRRPVGRRGRT